MDPEKNVDFGPNNELQGEHLESNKGTLLNHVEISVVESEKRSNNGTINLRDFYSVYLVETKTNNSLENKLPKLSTVWRRYTEFEQLRSFLEIEYPYIVMPPLPEKRVLFGWQNISSDTFDPNFIDRRRAGLENFLLRIASHPILSWNKHYLQFLQDEEAWKQAHNTNGYLQIAENKLRALSTTCKLKKPHPRFESSKEYSNKFYTNLYNLLKARSRIAEKQYNIYKLHANYGRVFSEWSVIEKGLGDSLQKSGHYLDSLASLVDTFLEDEEVLADQLKEYLFFASSMQNVYKHYESLQLKLDNAEDCLVSKNSEKSKIEQGKISLMSRFFGAVDTEELKELKLNALNQEIEEALTSVNKNNESLEDFISKASTDLQRFETQKTTDLKDTLTNYTIIQLKTAKKNLHTWTQIYECLQKLT